MRFYESRFHRQRGGASSTNHVYSTARAGNELFVASRTEVGLLSPRTMGAYEQPTTAPSGVEHNRYGPPRRSNFTDVPLSKVPSGAEFVSIDGLLPERIIAVAVRCVRALPGTMVKGSSFALHIYGSTSPPRSSWARISSDCQVIPLTYTPFCMRHVPVSFLPRGAGGKAAPCQ